MGGKSTILQETVNQATALESYLNINCNANEDIQYTVIPMMRYWHPMTQDIVKQVRGKYDDIVLLPLYPHFSTTTTLSSITEWFKRASHINNVHLVCCYYNHPGFIDAYTELINAKLDIISQNKTTRLLFSAHGIPEILVTKGDPYQFQIETTVKKIMEKIGTKSNLKYTICYQSKVGPMKWLEPNIESEILATGTRNEVVVVIPISFTSEHSETLVELDMDYADLAKSNNIEFYRVSTLQTNPIFIQTLAALTIHTLGYTNCELGIYQEKFPIDCPGKMCCKKLGFESFASINY
jgi:ferrochelatase